MKQSYWYIFLIWIWLSGCTTDPPSATKPIIIPEPPPPALGFEKPQVFPPISQAIPQIRPRPVSPVTPSLTPLSLSATRLPAAPAVPGGLAWIPLSSQSSTPPPIFYNQRRVVVVRNSQQWVALVGIPLEAHLGQHTVIDQQTATSYSFQVVNKNYQTQRLKFKGKAQAIKPEVLQRIQREAEIVKAILATPWRPTTTSLWPLVQPVHGRISGTFGLRRYINGEPRKPHSGVDIAVPLGTVVSAAVAGIVVNTGNYFFSGNTVFLDHGQGMISMYGHLSSIVVQAGQTVSSGQMIGRTGKTGRATGPHLHWAVSLNNTMVDPMLLVMP